jgi:hypothetical protein
MLRGFTDSTGVEWRVWEVFPSRAPSEMGTGELTRSSLKDTAFAHGWLCFESATDKRRLAPIPRGWEFLDTATLEQLRAKASPVPLRRNRLAPGVA